VQMLLTSIRTPRTLSAAKLQMDDRERVFHGAAQVGRRMAPSDSPLLPHSLPLPAPSWLARVRSSPVKEGGWVTSADVIRTATLGNAETGGIPRSAPASFPFPLWALSDRI